MHTINRILLLVGKNMNESNQKIAFYTKNYGYKNLSSLFNAIDLFEVKRAAGNSFLVKDKRKKHNKKASYHFNVWVLRDFYGRKNSGGADCIAAIKN